MPTIRDAMQTIQPPQRRTWRTRRPAYRYYAVGSIMHVLLAGALAGFGYRGSRGALAVAVILAVVGIAAWRRKAVIETRHTSLSNDPPVLHTDTQ
jgi:hypothetical protein